MRTELARINDDRNGVKKVLGLDPVPFFTLLMLDRERPVPGRLAAPRPLRQEAQADPDGLLAVAAAALGAGLREEPLRGRSREEAAGGKPELVRDAGEFHLLTSSGF